MSILIILCLILSNLGYFFPSHSRTPILFKRGGDFEVEDEEN